MNSQELRALQEAYNNVFEARVDKKLPEHERSGARLKRYDNPSGALALGGGQQRSRRAEHEERRGVKKEEVDLYDIILSHLLDDGYAESVEQAEVIMVNMSEDWRESIVEKHATFGYNADDPGDDFDQFVQKGPKTNKQKRQAIELNKKILSKKKN